jgi:diacylglycerol kinase (ATP)
VVAAGGDGTIDDVVNGIATVDGGLARTRLGVLPVGTANGLAIEYGIPFQLEAAWQVALHGHERLLDLPQVKCESNGKPVLRYFTHLASAGMEAKAQHLTSGHANIRGKKLSHLIAGIRALRGPQQQITVSTNNTTLVGESVLIGNGRLYGGRAEFFPQAKPDDGLLDLRIIPRITWCGVISNIIHIKRHRACQPTRGILLQTASFLLTAPPEAVFHVGGEFVGDFPAQFSLQSKKLRLLVRQTCLRN